MIYDKKYDRFFKIWKKTTITILVVSLLSLFVIGTIQMVIRGSRLDKNKVYTIGIYVGKSNIGNRYPCYDYYYNGMKYNQVINMVRDTLDVPSLILEKEFGERFLVEVDTTKPSMSKIRLDKSVPDDIQNAPLCGWKDIPIWDNEREKGNTGPLWDKTNAEKPRLKGDPRETWAICGVMLFLLLIVLRDVIEFFEELPVTLKKLWRGEKD